MHLYILHRHRYWTEYLDFLLEDEAMFSLICSKYASENEYKGVSLPLFDKKKHNLIVTPGLIDDKTENNKIIFRSQHSPGFYIIPHIIGYEAMCTYHAECDFRMMIIKNQYRAVVTREIKHPKIEEIQYRMLTDPRVIPMEVDLPMYQFRNKTRKVPRESGTALVCMRWLLMFVEFEKIIKMLKILRKQVKVSIVIHPCTESQIFINQIKQLKGEILEEVYYNVQREKMAELYDRHEFIVTDGSGACYEAMLRGCKPLAVRGLYCDNSDDHALEMYYDQLDEDFFPFQSYEEIGSYTPFDNEAYLKETFPFLYQYTYEEAKEIAKNEILEAAASLLASQSTP